MSLFSRVLYIQKDPKGGFLTRFLNHQRQRSAEPSSPTIRREVGGPAWRMFNNFSSGFSAMEVTYKMYPFCWHVHRYIYMYTSNIVCVYRCHIISMVQPSHLITHVRWGVSFSERQCTTWGILCTSWMWEICAIHDLVLQP